MALLWLDSFDNIGINGSQAALLTKYDAARSGTVSVQISTVNVRTGTCSLALGSAPTEHLCTKALGASGGTFIVGVGHYIPAAAFGVVTGNGYLIDITEEDQTIHLRLSINSTGQLSIYRNTTLIAGPSATALTFSTWYYIEFEGLISDTVGTYEVRVDGVTYLSGAGADTRNGGTGTWNRVILKPWHTAQFVMYDDLYICDGSGSINNTFLGIQKVGSSLAVADSIASGTTHNFTPSTGTDHGALVDESSPNGDTDYNASSTVGQIDLYRIQAVSLAGTTRGIQVNRYLKKTDAGVRTTRAIVRSAGTNYPQATQSPLTTYGYLSTPVETDPATATFWAAAAINAAEFGEEIVT